MSAILVVASEPGLGAVLQLVLDQAGLGPVESARPEHAIEVLEES